MGIGADVATIIIGAHKHKPLTGNVLLCGRQSVFLTPAQTADLFRSQGVIAQISIEECEVDKETRIGGEGQERRGGEAISDRSFFKMLGVESLTILDHSAYEGAALLIDLNYPIPTEREAKFDFIIDGGTLDNVFNPAQALMNLSRMLTSGGRLLTYNLYSNTYTPYTMLPHQWYLDYFAINQFDFAQVYFGVAEFSSWKSYYQVNHAKRAASRQSIGNFPIIDPRGTVGSVVYAVKGHGSSWDRQPSQEFYRSDEEWSLIAPSFARFAAYEMKRPILTSYGTCPIVLPGGDDFQYIDIDGNLITHATRSEHDKKLRANILKSLQAMEAQNGERPWGVLETEKLFFDLIAESSEACAILAKENVILFDARMLNQHTSIGSVRKEIYPAAMVTMLDIPILVITDEPEIEALWKRASRYFRHLRLHAACHGNLPNYFGAGATLSPSLEHGEYRGSPLGSVGKIQELLTKLAPREPESREKNNVRSGPVRNIFRLGKRR